MIITRQDPFTGIVNTMDLPITKAQINDYASGTLLQIAFPACNADQREFFKTGIMPDSWDKFLMPDDEE